MQLALQREHAMGLLCRWRGADAWMQALEALKSKLHDAVSLRYGNQKRHLSVVDKYLSFFSCGALKRFTFRGGHVQFSSNASCLLSQSWTKK